MLSLITSFTIHLVENWGSGTAGRVKVLYYNHFKEGRMFAQTPQCIRIFFLMLFLPYLSPRVKQKRHPQQLSPEGRHSDSEGRLHCSDQQFVIEVL